jgi:hypothetical protein
MVPHLPWFLQPVLVGTGLDVPEIIGIRGGGYAHSGTWITSPKARVLRPSPLHLEIKIVKLRRQVSPQSA